MFLSEASDGYPEGARFQNDADREHRKTNHHQNLPLPRIQKTTIIKI